MSTEKAARGAYLPGRSAAGAVVHSPGDARVENTREMVKGFKARYANEIGQRCRAARGSIEISVVADHLGVHRNTIWNIERGDSLPDAFDILRLAKLYGTSADYLLTGEQREQEDRPEADVVPPAVNAVEHGRYVYVPHFDVSASAGNGDVFNSVERVKAMRPFDKNYIRGDLDVGHGELALISVVGSSMEPLLHSGDTVLVDLRARHEMFSDGIHVIRLDEALLVKQVQRLPGRVFRIRSLNPDYEPFEIKATEEVERDFAIIGRVRWGGITIK